MVVIVNMNVPEPITSMTIDRCEYSFPALVHAKDGSSRISRKSGVCKFTPVNIQDGDLLKLDIKFEIEILNDGVVKTDSVWVQDT
jgi:hypothetical protein